MCATVWWQNQWRTGGGDCTIQQCALITRRHVKILSVHGVLHYTPYLIVHQVQVRTVGGPWSRRDQVWSFLCYSKYQLSILQLIPTLWLNWVICCVADRVLICMECFTSTPLFDHYHCICQTLDMGTTDKKRILVPYTLALKSKSTFIAVDFFVDKPLVPVSSGHLCQQIIIIQ